MTYYEKEYKYWFFYIKPEFIDQVYIEEKDSLLYAYTDNKNHALLFMQRRNMDKFFMKKKRIKKSEVHYLAEYFSREYLSEMKIKTRGGCVGSKLIDYTMIITKTEEMMITKYGNQVTLSEIWKCTWTNPYIFNSDYLDTLINIGYADGYDMIAGSTYSKNETPIEINEQITPDFLSVFIHHFGYLLK